MTNSDKDATFRVEVYVEEVEDLDKYEFNLEIGNQTAWVKNL